MAETIDYSTDIKKYTPNVNENAVKGIVKYCGIALQSKDASLVATTDPAERARVRDNFMKKKLGLTDPDAALDASIKTVTDRMKAARDKSRVTFYYLLAEMHGKLSSVGG